MREISESIGLIDILSAGFNGCNIYFLGGNAYALVKSIAYFLIFWYSLGQSFIYRHNIWFMDTLRL